MEQQRVRRAKSESKSWAFRAKPPGGLRVVSSAAVNSPWNFPSLRSSSAKGMNSAVPGQKNSAAKSEREISLLLHQVCDAVRGVDLHMQGAVGFPIIDYLGFLT